MGLAEHWRAAVSALRGGSVSEILALHNAGAISVAEVLESAWRVCQDDPGLRAELVQRFRADPDEYVRSWVGGSLEELATSRASVLAGSGGTQAEPANGPDAPDPPAEHAPAPPPASE